MTLQINISVEKDKTILYRKYYISNEYEMLTHTILSLSLINT